MSSADNSYFLSTITQNLNNNSISTPTLNAGQSSSCIQYQQQHPLSNNGTTAVSLTDDLVKEYLLYRGFTSTLRVFDQDLKQDRDRSLRADKIAEQLVNHIHSFDINGFIDYWSYLDQKYFSKLATKIGGQAVKRYELNLMRYYLVNAVKTGKMDKAFEFIENYLAKLQSQSEWKEWYGLPFVKKPEEHPFFSVYFNQEWIQHLLVSFQNFLNISFQSVPFPRLLNYDESLFWAKQNKVQVLTHENLYVIYLLFAKL